MVDPGEGEERIGGHFPIFLMLNHTQNSNIPGWWFEPHPSEKYEFVNWDDVKFPIYGKIKNGNQTTNQIQFSRHIELPETQKVNWLLDQTLTSLNAGTFLKISPCKVSQVLVTTATL